MGEKSVQHFCLVCAQETFNIWKGWPTEGAENWSVSEKRKTRLPEIPRFKDGKCPVCNSQEALTTDRIYYQNIHGPGNTGLPDYFVLRIAIDSNDETVRSHHKRFGAPYLDTEQSLIPIQALHDHVKNEFPGSGKG